MVQASCVYALSRGEPIEALRMVGLAEGQFIFVPRPATAGCPPRPFFYSRARRALTVSVKRVIRQAPHIRPSVIDRSPADAYLALVLLRLRGSSSHAIGLPNVKNPTPIEQDQGVQLQKASAIPGQQALIQALAVIASPALACLQVSTMACTG